MILTVTEPRLIWSPKVKVDEHRPDAEIVNGVVVKEGHLPHRMTSSRPWVPGDNDLDPTYWGQIKDLPYVRRLLASGSIRVSDGEAKPLVPASPPTDLSGCSEEEARVWIVVEKSVDRLLDWYEREKRESVRTLIAERGQALEGGE